MKLTKFLKELYEKEILEISNSIMKDILTDGEVYYLVENNNIKYLTKEDAAKILQGIELD